MVLFWPAECFDRASPPIAAPSGSPLAARSTSTVQPLFSTLVYLEFDSDMYCSLDAHGRANLVDVCVAASMYAPIWIPGVSRLNEYIS